MASAQRLQQSALLYLWRRQATMKVIEYLANYVGRIALSDSRILDIDGDWVLFKYKDYRDNNEQKTTRLPD